MGGREASSQHGSCEKRWVWAGVASRRSVGVFQRPAAVAATRWCPGCTVGTREAWEVRGDQRTKSFCHEMQRMPPLSGARVGVGAARNKSRRRTSLRSPRPGDAGGRLARPRADVVFLTQHCVFVQRDRASLCIGRGVVRVLEFQFERDKRAESKRRRLLLQPATAIWILSSRQDRRRKEALLTDCGVDRALDC